MKKKQNETFEPVKVYLDPDNRNSIVFVGEDGYKKFITCPPGNNRTDLILSKNI